VACSPGRGVYVPAAPAYNASFHMRLDVGILTGTAAGLGARCTAEELSFYGVGVSVSVNGGADANAGDGESGSEPRCRRCPALRPDTAYVAYIAAVGLFKLKKVPLSLQVQAP
jgi:hypothetical protein